jgi:hypothetical protein
MQKQGLLETAPQVTSMPIKSNSSNATDAVGISTPATPPAEYHYLHLKLALPQDPTQRQKLLQSLHLQADLMGASVVACHLE